MEEDFLRPEVAAYPDESLNCGYHFPSKSIRLFPVKKESLPPSHQSFEFMHGSNLNSVSLSNSIPLTSSGEFLSRRNYIFIGGCCFLKPASSRRLFPPESMTGARSSSTKTRTRTSTADNNDIDLSSCDLTVGLQFCRGILDEEARCYMHCHFDNNPEKARERSVMIALKFNDIRAVIQAHGYLDGCSQFVKVDLGFGDDEAVASGKRFSTVLTSTFPRKPRHPDECFLSGRLCTISDFQKVVCQLKSETKLKFLQGHISVSIHTGDYWDDCDLPKRHVIFKSTCGNWDTDEDVEDDESNFPSVSTSDQSRLAGNLQSQMDVYFLSSTDNRKFPVKRAAIEWKSHHFAELIKMYLSLEKTNHFPLNYTSDVVRPLATFIQESTFGSLKISCPTAVMLLELAKEFRIQELEEEICQVVMRQKDPNWFDLSSLVKLFLLCREGKLGERSNLKCRTVQAFQMKREEEDTDGIVENLFLSNPEAGADLFLQALTICSPETRLEN